MDQKVDEQETWHGNIKRVLGRVRKKISALYRTIFPCFGKIVNLDDDISRYIYISRRTGKGRLWAIEGDEDEDNEAEVDIM